MGNKHLELLKVDDHFCIQINTLVGRISLFTDHPLYKFKDAINLKKSLYKTTGDLSLVKLRRKNLYILEDKDAKGNISQNFVFVAECLSETMQKNSLFQWFKEHLFDYFTRSIAVLFLILYALYFFTTMRYFNTMNTLYALRFITGVFTLVFATTYYYLRSVKTKSSFLKFCFKAELLIFIVTASINNYEYLVNFMNGIEFF